MDKNVFDELMKYGMVIYKESGEILTSKDLSPDNHVMNGVSSDGFFKLKKIYVTKEVRKVRWNGLGRACFESFEVDPENPIFQEVEGVLYTRKGFDRDGNTNRKKMIELVACPTMVPYHRVIPGTIRIACCAFKGSQIMTLELPDTLQEIGVNAFYFAKNLRTLEIPSNIKRIEPQKETGTISIRYNNSTFRSWKDLEEHLLSQGFTRIGETRTIERK